jgi:hypothetical protein
MKQPQQVWIPAPITLTHFSILGKLSENATDSKFLLVWPNKERNLEEPTLVYLLESQFSIGTEKMN